MGTAHRGSIPLAVALLVDGRFPAGAHAHSGGMEQAVDERVVVDGPTLAMRLAAQATTVVELAASAAAMVCHRLGPAMSAWSDHAGRSEQRELQAPPGGDWWGDWWEAIDAELDARTPSPALRATSRRLGGQLLMTARSVFPGPVPDRLADRGITHPHHAMAVGAVSAGAGLETDQAAFVVAYSAAAGGAGAALRLLGLDPLGVAAVIAGHEKVLDAVVARAVAGAGGAPCELPAPATPWFDLF
ncbi:MAG: urease accessory protein UreF, partial [Acidimicrobiales bacterium]